MNEWSSQQTLSWWRLLEDVFRLRLQKTHSRRLQNVLIKANLFVLVIRLQDIFQTSCKDVFKISSRRFQDVLSSQTVLIKWSSRRLWDVFNTFLRRTAKVIIYRRIWKGHTFEKFMVRPLTSGWGFKIMSWLLFPVYKLSRENTQGENMWQRFLKRRKVVMRQ